MKARILCVGFLCVLFGITSAPARAQEQDGATLFKTWCASCHESTTDESRAPRRAALAQLTPEQILTALEKGAMKAQGLERSRAQRRALAEYLSGKALGNEEAEVIPKSAYCSGGASPLATDAASPAWNGWGATVRNMRFQDTKAAGISANDVPRLKLKWAFGFPGATSASAQPVIVNGRVFLGSWTGDVYSLDAKTGCIYWSFDAGSAIWNAVSIGKVNGNYTAFFGDTAANVYALDATTGELLWKMKVEDHPMARVTGSPTFYEGRLYVPVASREESWAVDRKYECCRFRGSVSALDAATGKRIWKTYTISDEPHPTQKSQIGTQLWGPSGGGVWSSPTIDAKRKLIYVGTGNSYSFPESNNTDAILALDMNTGNIRWSHQVISKDVWTVGCGPTSDPVVCAENAPDEDFGSSPILIGRKGKDVLFAGNKAAMIYAFDPDHEGKLIWQQRVGKGSGYGGIVWGSASDGENFYAPISDPDRIDGKIVPNSGGGLVAVSLDSGKQVWKTPAPPCGDKDPCGQGQIAAVTVIPGVVFSGSVDGHLRAYSTSDGKIIWDYDTAHDYTAVDGVKTQGGSMSVGGAAIAGGMMYVNSGFVRSNGVIPGNVLLAFSAE